MGCGPVPSVAPVSNPREAAGKAVGRVRSGAWSVGQCAIAAGVAWQVATVLLDHPRPFFACVAAVVCLGVRAAQRLRRVAELAVGVTVGVAVGDLLVGAIGTGAWQIALVVGIALMLGLALDGGPLVSAQAGLQAVFVIALPRIPGSGVARWEDAMVGGAMALAVAAFLPADPWRAAQRSASQYFGELSEVLKEVAGAARVMDGGRVAEALARGRALEPVLHTWSEALATGRDISRLSPLRPDRGDVWLRQTRLVTGVDRASRNLRVLIRRVVVGVEMGQELPPSVPLALDRLAAPVALLRDDPLDDRGEATKLLVDLAGSLDPAGMRATSVAALVAVAQLRVSVVELLEGLGTPQERARAALPPLG